MNCNFPIGIERKDVIIYFTLSCIRIEHGLIFFFRIKFKPASFQYNIQFMARYYGINEGLFASGE